MRRSFYSATLASCLALGALVISEREAHAGPYLGVDLDLGTAFQNNVDFSYGLGARFGWKCYFAGAPIWILPEVGGHFMSFGSATEFGSVGNAFGGLRIGFDGLVQPNLFAHAGVGYVGNSTLGPYTDVGVGVDFQITRAFSLGLQVAYNSVYDDSSQYGATNWASFGLNFGIDFTRPYIRRVEYYR